ncbi:MAG TPA: GNAT family protein [Ilumatobacteraceae bacterium]|nr:GNAT family protein [Ilumatobacteraceae bacterium]
MPHPHWPLFDVEVRTPRLALRYADDIMLTELATLAAKGIHDPAQMPFAIPWTDIEPPQLEREAFRFWWGCRADTSPAKWNLILVALVGDTVVGSTSIGTSEFAVTRAFETGSWLGREYQGQGLGKEMRYATLQLGFDGFGAEQATTGAFTDNPASLGVTRSLGYEPNGQLRHERRGELAESLRFRMSREHWDTIRRDDITLHGVEAAAAMLGL